MWNVSEVKQKSEKDEITRQKENLTTVPLCGRLKGISGLVNITAQWTYAETCLWLCQMPQLEEYFPLFDFKVLQLPSERVLRSRGTNWIVFLRRYVTVEHLLEKCFWHMKNRYCLNTNIFSGNKECSWYHTQFSQLLHEVYFYVFPNN